MGDDKDSDSVNRRSVLNRLSESKADEEVPERKRRGLMKGMAVSALSAFGLASVPNSAAAKKSEDVRALDHATVESILKERTKVRQLLANNGLIADAAVETLMPDTVATPDDRHLEGVYESDYKTGDGLEPFVRVEKVGPKGQFSVAFQRDSNRFFIDTPEKFDDDVLLEDWNDEPVSVTWNNESGSATSGVSPKDNTGPPGGGGGGCEQPNPPGSICGTESCNTVKCNESCHLCRCVSYLYTCTPTSGNLGYWCSCCCYTGGGFCDMFPCCGGNDPAC